MLIMFKFHKCLRRRVCAQCVRCKDRSCTSQHYLRLTVSVCGWSIAEGVSFGTLQGWLIPEHGWLEARGGSGGEGAGVGQGQLRLADLTLNHETSSSVWHRVLTVKTTSVAIKALFK